jgi:uncharacterized protein (TIRG00374 family)
MMPKKLEVPSKLKKIALFAVSTAILAGLVYISGPEKFFNALSKSKLLFLVPAVIVGTSVFLVWSFAWYRVFQKTGIEASYTESVKLQFAGNFLNNITPFGQIGGEPFMAYIVSTEKDAKYEEALSSVLSADILNMIPPFTFVFGGAIYIIFFRSVTDLIIQAIYMSLIVLLFGGILVYTLWFEAGKIESFILNQINRVSNRLGRGEKLVKRLEKRLDNFEESMGKMGEDPLYLAKTILILHIGFILEVVCLSLVMVSLGLTPLLSYLYFILPLADLANTSPTPGGTGTYEAALAALLVAVSEASTGFVGGPIPFSVALLIGILFRLSTYWPSLVLGYISFNLLKTNR